MARIIRSDRPTTHSVSDRAKLRGPWPTVRSKGNALPIMGKALAVIIVLAGLLHVAQAVL